MEVGESLGQEVMSSLNPVVQLIPFFWGAFAACHEVSSHAIAGCSRQAHVHKSRVPQVTRFPPVLPCCRQITLHHLLQASAERAQLLWDCQNVAMWEVVVSSSKLMYPSHSGSIAGAKANSGQAQFKVTLEQIKTG